MTDLAGDPASSGVLVEWRRRMVEHLAPRGEHWVRGGKLMLRTDDPVRSPNFPK
jgi:arylsulfatase